jgi:hypothetical protein
MWGANSCVRGAIKKLKQKKTPQRKLRRMLFLIKLTNIQGIDFKLGIKGGYYI